jgi:hypothetical protein
MCRSLKHFVPRSNKCAGNVREARILPRHPQPAEEWQIWLCTVFVPSSFACSLLRVKRCSAALRLRIAAAIILCVGVIWKSEEPTQKGKHRALLSLLSNDAFRALFKKCPVVSSTCAGSSGKRCAPASLAGPLAERSPATTWHQTSSHHFSLQSAPPEPDASILRVPKNVRGRVISQDFDSP